MFCSVLEIIIVLGIDAVCRPNQFDIFSLFILEGNVLLKFAQPANQLHNVKQQNLLKSKVVALMCKETVPVCVCACLCGEVM